MAKSKQKNNEFGYEDLKDKEEVEINLDGVSSDAFKLLMQRLGEKSPYLQNREGNKELTTIEVFADNIMQGVALKEEKAMAMVSDILKFTTKQELLNQEALLLAKWAEDKTKEARYTLLNGLSLFGYISFADFHRNKIRYGISGILLEGGRFAGKTYSGGDYVIYRALDRQPLIEAKDDDDIRNIDKINKGRGGRIYCGRAVEGDVEGSVFAMVTERITKMGLTKLFDIKKSVGQIICKHNDVVIQFTGFNKLVDNGNEGMKGWENTFLVWVDEAQSVSFNILQKVYNTIIRTPESILLMTMNRRRKDDDAYVMATETYKSAFHVQRFCYLENPFLDEMARKTADLARIEQPVLWRKEYLGEPDLSYADSYWDMQLISRMHIVHKYEDVKHLLVAKVIAIDPASTDAKAETANEWGLMAIGKAYDTTTGNEKYYLLDDFSSVFSDINSVFELILNKCIEYEIRSLVYEKNGVGVQMSSFNNFLFYKRNMGLLDKDFNVTMHDTWAKSSKQEKHAVLAEFSQRGCVHFLSDRVSMILEHQMQQCTPRKYMGKGSPDRVDAFNLGVGHLSHVENQVNVSRIFKLSMFGEKPNDKDRWVKQPIPIITVGTTGTYSAIIIFYLYQHYDTGDLKIFIINYNIFETRYTVRNVVKFKEMYKTASINLEFSDYAKSVVNSLWNEGIDNDEIYYIRWSDKYKNGNFSMKVDLVQPYIMNGFVNYPLDIDHIVHKDILDNWLIRDFLEYDIDKKEESPIIKAISNAVQGIFGLNA